MIPKPNEQEPNVGRAMHVLSLSKRPDMVGTAHPTITWISLR